MADLIPSGAAPLMPPAQTLPLETEARLIAAIHRVADAEFVPYLLEVWRCYTTHAYNSALVWLWCAASCYIREVVRHLGEDIFWLRFGETYESLERIHDDQLLEACRKMGILGLSDPARFGWISDFRTRRNDLAHGHWNEATTPQVVADLAESAVENLLAVSVRDHALAVDTTTIYDLTRDYPRPIDEQRAAELIAAVVDPANLQEVCHRIVALYVAEDAANAESVRRVWRATYERLEYHQRLTVAQRLIRDMARSLGLGIERDEDGWAVTGMSEEDAEKVRSERKFRALLDLDLWRDTDLEGIYHEGYYEVFLRLFQEEVKRRKTGGGMEIPGRYFKEIRDRAPEKFKAQVNELNAQL